MLEGRLKGLTPGIAATAVAVTMSVLGGTAAAQDPAPELLPDLQGLPAEDLSIQSGAGPRSLRLSSSIANGGDGAFEVFPEPGTGDDCDGDGGSNDDRFAFQRVFKDVDGNGTFDRTVDTTSVTYPVGCMIFHPVHNHWHFEQFASYELRLPDTGEVVASTSKVGFCLVDYFPFAPTLPGHPSDDYYGTCSADATEGISVGWADTYLSNVPGQAIDISQLSDGDYCLAVTGDPADIVRETNESNNEAQTLITLIGNTVTNSGGPCVASSRHAKSEDLKAQATRGGKCAKRAKKGAKKKRRCRRR